MIPYHKLYILTAQNFWTCNIANLGCAETCENTFQRVSVHSGICLCTSECIHDRNCGNIMFHDGASGSRTTAAVTMFLHRRCTVENNASTLTVVQASHVHSA